MQGHRRALIACAGVVWALGAAGAAGAAVDLEVFERAAPTVVAIGEVVAVEPLDPRAWRLDMRCDEPLNGDGDGVMTRSVVFESPMRGGATPAEVGDRLLLALEPLRLTTAWRKRLGASATAAHWTVADNGRALVRRPASGAIEILRHFLRLPAIARNGSDGVRHLLALAAEVPVPLGAAAARRLRSTRPGGPVPAPVADLVVRSLRREQGDIVNAVLQWIEEARPAGLVDALEHASAAEDAPAAVFEARARLSSGLEPRTILALGDHAEATHREVAARWAARAQGDRLEDWATHDPDADVRIAAIRRRAAIGLDSQWGRGAFGDAEPRVRGEAARIWAAAGDADIGPIRDAVFGDDIAVAQTAILALHLSGRPEAISVLEEAARTHPSAELRKVAGIALGQPLGEVHLPAD